MIEPTSEDVFSWARSLWRNERVPAAPTPVPEIVPSGTATDTPAVSPCSLARIGDSVVFGPAMTGAVHPAAARAASTAATAPVSSSTTSTFGWAACTAETAAAAPAPEGDTVARATMANRSAEEIAARWAAPSRLALSPVTMRPTRCTPSALRALPMTKACDSIEAVMGKVLG